MPIVNCKNCKKEFNARQADLNRGWAKFCSKSCKAIQQVKKHPQHYKKTNMTIEEEMYIASMDGCEMGWDAHKD